MVPFGIKFSNMSKLKRREEDLPSPNQIKQLNVFLKEKIKNLNSIVHALLKDRLLCNTNLSFLWEKSLKPSHKE
jgi:hypothetical protein